MSNKIKPRQMRKPRNLIVRDMILTRRGGTMQDKREKRTNRNNERRRYIEEYV